MKTTKLAQHLMVLMICTLALVTTSCDGQDNPTAPTAINTDQAETATAATTLQGTAPPELPAALPDNLIGNPRAATVQTDTQRCNTIYAGLSTIVGDRRAGPSVHESKYIYRRGPDNDSLRFRWGPPGWLSGQVIGYWYRVQRLQPVPKGNWGPGNANEKGWKWRAKTAGTTHYVDEIRNEPEDYTGPPGPQWTPKYRLQVRVCYKLSNVVYVHRRRTSLGSQFTVE